MVVKRRTRKPFQIIHCHWQHHNLYYANNLAILIDNNHHIQPQINKSHKFVECVHIDLSLNKCALTGYPHKSKLNTATFKAYLQIIHNLQATHIPYPLPRKNYAYLGIRVNPSLN